MLDKSINTINLRLSQYVKVALLSTSIMTLSGCIGVNSDNETLESASEKTEVSEPEVVQQPEQVGLSALHTDGTKWVNAEGEQVLLKGVNLGNWLLQEFWMMGQSTADVNDQCTLENTLTDRFGYQEKERLMKVFHDNWMTERDWDNIASFDMNVVRVPFLYSVIEDELNPMTLRSDAWEYLDLAISEAEKRDMYVILDLHGAVGGQGWEHHSGCAGLNEYWGDEVFQERTRWLWQQIATRYKDNGVVAGYGVLNEPWGTSEENLAIEVKELYDAIREVDEDHIVILPGHNSGINGYGNPAENGMTNVAFEMHFYPGIFGWGEIGYDVHRDWLRCGESGTGGVCEWNDRITALDTPFLNGEFQPWAGLGELGADITRASFDTYASYGWASTAWAYKVLTNGGGQGAGTWGLVTNAGLDFDEKLVAANTWACAGWESDFANACDTSNVSFTAQTSRTAYLVVKTGALNTINVSYDNLSLLNESTGNEMLVNGEFGSNTGWTEWQANGSQSFDYTNTTDTPSGASGAVLTVTGGAANGGIYQAIELEAGVTYTFSGVFKDNGSTDSWAEVFLVPSEPVTGEDVSGTQILPQADFLNDSIEEIEQLFTSFGTMEYDVHEDVRAALTAEQASGLFSIPARPTGLTVVEGNESVSLTWDANSEADVTGYNVYRSTSPGGIKALLAENIIETSFEDNDNLEGNRYYVVAAVDPEDISYFSEQSTTSIEKLSLPGRIEAENFNAMYGFEFEDAQDTGGGQNSGFADPDDYLDYQVYVETTGTYTVTYRLATNNGSPEGFQLLSDGDLIETVVVPATGGWQTWIDVTTTVELTAGEQTLRLLSIGKEWNFNWMEFSIAP
ncbi:MAG: cellulase family glycosylhydrolase [Colwellia sp.]|nr:cellulase family glycosylhydrolase [Colwellia sp.]